MSKHAKPEATPTQAVSVILDNTALVHGMRKLNPDHTMLDALHVMLDTKGVHSVIIPNSIRQIELSGSYVHPETGETVHVRESGLLPKIQELQATLGTYPTLKTTAELETHLGKTAPQQNKWLIFHSPYAETRNSAMHQLHEQAENEKFTDKKLYRTLAKRKLIKSNMGEKDIVHIIQNTAFGRPVYIISDDARAFYNRETSPYYVEHLRTKDDFPVHFSTLEHAMDSFLSAPHRREAIEKELNTTTEKLIQLSRPRTNMPFNLHIVSNKKWAYPVQDSLKTIFDQSSAHETNEQWTRIEAMIPQSFAARTSSKGRGDLSRT